MRENEVALGSLDGAMRPVFLLPLACALALTACASAPVRVPERVLVPVAVCEVPDLPPSPALPVDSVADNAPASEKAKALAASVRLLRARVQSLEDMLASLKKSPAPANDAR